MRFIIAICLTLTYICALKQANWLQGANGIQGNQMVPIAAGIGGDGK
jgi:hypothetical protein